MSDPEKVGWAYRLNKTDVIEELKEQGIVADESQKLDDLRKLLVKTIRKTGQKSTRDPGEKPEGEPVRSEAEDSEHESQSSGESSEMASEKSKLPRKRRLGNFCRALRDTICSKRYKG
ncbi:hypothetical protein RF55_11490 [Lasius niger]|uniref:Uncharacterized protein n=1 Tax=Lasius niger TaxID=67767 RepID=A0A0J7KEQ2_LASNI|nr:hypothetical protein RF55_11490 [Lasius niger]